MSTCLFFFKTDKVSLKRGQTITLTTHQGWKEKGSADKVYVDYHNLSYILKPKDRVFLDFGRIELVVRGTGKVMRQTKPLSVIPSK